MSDQMPVRRRMGAIIHKNSLDARIEIPGLPMAAFAAFLLAAVVAVGLVGSSLLEIERREKERVWEARMERMLLQVQAQDQGLKQHAQAIQALIQRAQGGSETPTSSSPAPGAMKPASGGDAPARTTAEPPSSSAESAGRRASPGLPDTGTGAPPAAP